MGYINKLELKYFVCTFNINEGMVKRGINSIWVTEREYGLRC